jgi:hypothetical protein
MSTAPTHGSTDFIKRQSLTTGSTTQIKPIKSVSWLLISIVHHRSDGWLPPGAACRGQAWGLDGVQVFSSYGGQFSMRFAPTGSQRWGEHVYANFIGGEQQWSSTTVRQLDWGLSMVRAASGEASAPSTCAKASLSSLLASRLTNCSDRWWKTRIWWLPRVRRVLDLRPKILTICDAIYTGF